MKNRTQLLLNILVVTLLVFTSMYACTVSSTEQEQDRSVPDEEQRQIEEEEFDQLFMELKNTINDIDYEIGKLCNYKWNSELGSVGFGKEDKHGVRRDMTVIEIINTELASDRETLQNKLGNGRNSISNVWNDRPYRQAQSSTGELEQDIIDEWKFQCSDMSSKLNDLQKALVDLQDHTTNLIDELLYGLKYQSMSGSLLYYADILANDADEYHKFVDETMNDINKACDLAVELQECNFSTLVKNTAD